MLRLSVECDEVPEQVTVAVHQLSQHASTYLRRVSPTYAAYPHTLTSDTRDVTNSCHCLPSDAFLPRLFPEHRRLL
jgi:hypothetical protein